MATRAASGAEILMEAYEEEKDRLQKKDNTTTAMNQQQKVWKSTALMHVNLPVISPDTIHRPQESQQTYNQARTRAKAKMTFDPRRHAFTIFKT